MRVAMVPHLSQFDQHESGIKRVVEAYFKYLPEYGIELIDTKTKDYDILVAHAGMTSHKVDVAHLHGLYWTADYQAPIWEYRSNENIVMALRNAKEVTVPSEWVAETIRRDMRFNPHVVNHGIEWEEWQNDVEQGKYVLWNKNRNFDVCDPTPMVKLADRFSNINFVTTFLPVGDRWTKHPNTRVTGLMPFPEMKKAIQEAAIYLSTTKETFGIGTLEAMASGVPVLGYAWGGNVELVDHGVSGYLARPGDFEDLAAGLAYCIQHHGTLSSNARELAKKWTWQERVGEVAEVYRLATQTEPDDVAVIIPCFNYAHVLEGAVKSALSQSFPARQIIIVDDGSTDDTLKLGKELSQRYDTVKYIRQDNSGVANARNTGIGRATTKYICCLDADDRIDGRFLEVCVDALSKDRSLGIAYTGITATYPDGREQVTDWPGVFDYNRQITPRSKDNWRGFNQIPTCNVFRKEMWRRLGGYNQRYAPLGAGAEDAELWTRAGSIGYNAHQVSKAGMFRYAIGSGITSKNPPDLVEPPWLADKPWVFDGFHPFASIANPILNRKSHPVRQYDQPVVSIIIPVGPNHEDVLRDALNSLEAQLFRRWEAIVVYDTVNEYHPLMEAYPYVKYLHTGGGKGAGYARNRGVDIARAPFLVFLDADDELKPDFLETVIEAWGATQSIIYTDYYNVIETTKEDLDTNFSPDEIKAYNPATGVATIVGRSSDYDCERAQKQPVKKLNDVYHWSLVTCLVPIIWHREIGGFREDMESFEDVHYHWAMARAGKCYVRVADNLVSYRMFTGHRRKIADPNTEEGLQVARKMLQYAGQLLERTETVGCKGCPGTRRKDDRMRAIRQAYTPQQLARAQQGDLDENYELCVYAHPNIGNHIVNGAATGIKYGYRKGGDTFLVHKEDIGAQPHYFKVIHDATPDIPAAQINPLPPPAPIKPGEDRGGAIMGMTIDPESGDFIIATVDLTVLPGITPEIAKQLQDNFEVDSKEDIIALGVEGLQEVKGIGPAKAQMILDLLGE